MTYRVSRNRWVWRLGLITCLLFLNGTAYFIKDSSNCSE